MITCEDVYRGVNVLKRFGASRVVFFGSARTHPIYARDLDLGCNGLEPTLFYDAVATLIEEVGKPVDLIDLDKETGISRHVNRFGEIVYMSDGEFINAVRNELNELARSAAFTASLAKKPPSQERDAALALTLHGIYGGLENVFGRFYRFHGIALPTGSAWHVQIVDAFSPLGSPPLPVLITTDIQPLIHKLRGFRPVVRSNYALNIDPVRLQPNADGVSVWLPTFSNSVEAALKARGAD